METLLVLFATNPPLAMLTVVITAIVVAARA